MSRAKELARTAARQASEQIDALEQRPLLGFPIASYRRFKEIEGKQLAFVIGHERAVRAERRPEPQRVLALHHWLHRGDDDPDGVRARVSGRSARVHAAFHEQSHRSQSRLAALAMAQRDPEEDEKDQDQEHDARNPDDGVSPGDLGPLHDSMMHDPCRPDDP